MYSISLQDGWAPVMFKIGQFHDHVMLVIFFIMGMVCYILASMLIFPAINRNLYRCESLESIWTILPGLILWVMAIPSLHTLYLLDEVQDCSLSIKAVGHQWYWSYEYSDFEGLEFDSYMMPEVDLKSGSFRLLDVDNRTVLPAETSIRVLVTSSDVIHSWTIPSMGVKADAVPGRLNQLGVFSNRVGMAYGQCSEICGAMHSFMPICLEVVPSPVFESWVKSS
nr:cytochrome c oxidase subunit 2 [Pectinopygus varius]